MDSIALGSDKQRETIFSKTADKLSLPPYVVEQDFWVSWLLSKIFANPELHDILRLNGGVSVSKAYNIIERDPSDVDLVINKNVVLGPGETIEQPSHTKQLSFNRELDRKDTEFVQTVLRDKVAYSLGNVCTVDGGGGNSHVLSIRYPYTFEHSYPIKLEAGIPGSWSPCEDRLITSFVAKALPQLKLCEPVVPTVVAGRTFWDKIIILHREAHRPINTNPPPSRCSRHYYDLFRLGHSDFKYQAFAHLEILKTVADFNIRVYPRAWAKYDEAKSGIVKLIPPEYSIPTLKSDYQERIQPAIYGDAPDFETILVYLIDLEKEINSLSR